MEAWLQDWLQGLLGLLALPQYGLSTVFVVAAVSATLLPLGSEPAVFGLVKLNPSLFWPAVLVATAGNTLGGAVTWWMGYGAERAYEKVTHHKPHELRALKMLERFGARACLLSWLPLVGDPLCAVAGWLRLPFWPCVGYMAIGKFGRYLVMTAGLLWLWPGQMAA
jgi:membrane protein YqaA with SNARE-associated domain